HVVGGGRGAHAPILQEDLDRRRPRVEGDVVAADLDRLRAGDVPDGDRLGNGLERTLDEVALEVDALLVPFHPLAVLGEDVEGLRVLELQAEPLEHVERLVDDPVDERVGDHLDARAEGRFETHARTSALPRPRPASPGPAASFRRSARPSRSLLMKEGSVPQQPPTTFTPSAAMACRSATNSS